jgi:integrase/recombinase XerD
MVRQTTPTHMAKKLARLLRPERPDYAYVKKVFQHTRALLAVKPMKTERRFPELLTDAELVAFYEAVWQARNSQHMVLIKLLLFTGLRNVELAHVRRQDVDLDHCQIRVVRGKGGKDRSVLFPLSFRGELAQYMQGSEACRVVYLFESNRMRPYSTRRIRQIIHAYALAAPINKRVYPHLFRHQLMTFLTRKGLMSPQLQLLSGHAEERNLAIYRDLALRMSQPSTSRRCSRFRFDEGESYCVSSQLPSRYPLLEARGYVGNP